MGTLALHPKTPADLFLCGDACDAADVRLSTAIGLKADTIDYYAISPLVANET